LWHKIDNRHITINSYTMWEMQCYSFKVGNKQKEETNKQGT